MRPDFQGVRFCEGDALPLKRKLQADFIQLETESKVSRQFKRPKVRLWYPECSDLLKKQKVLDKSLTAWFRIKQLQS